MFSRLLVAIAVIVALVNASIPDAKSVSASVRDTSVDGFEGINLKWEAPFKFDDYVVGFRYHLGNLKKLPQSLFAKRKFATDNFDGTANVDLDYDVEDKVLRVDAKWRNKKDDLEISANGDTKDRLREIGIQTKRVIEGKNVELNGQYNLLDKKLGGSAKVNVDDTSVEVSYDNVDKDPRVKVDHKFDSKNTISPAINLKSREMSYGWTRKWEGGSVEAVYHPGDRVDVNWKDEGSNGVWNTKAEIPVDDVKSSKVTFSRDWNY